MVYLKNICNGYFTKCTNLKGISKLFEKTWSKAQKLMNEDSYKIGRIFEMFDFIATIVVEQMMWEYNLNWGADYEIH